MNDFEKIEFVQDEDNPKAVRDLDGNIVVYKNYRDTRGNGVNFIISWRGGFDRIVLAEEVLSKEDRSLGVTVAADVLCRSIFRKKYLDCRKEAEAFFPYFKGAVVALHIKKYRRAIDKFGVKLPVNITLPPQQHR